MGEKILKESILLFQQRGFSETSIQDIVDVIGVTKRSFYYHYTSKESLLMDIQQRYIDNLLEREQDILEKSLSCRDRLTQTVELIILDIKSQGPNGRIFFRETRNLNPENSAVIQKKRECFRLRIERLLEEGVSAGEFHEEICPR